MKKTKQNKKLVSTQDEAGLATRWVSSAPCRAVVTSRWGRGLCLLLLVLLLLLCYHIFREIHGSNNNNNKKKRHGYPEQLILNRIQLKPM